MSAGPTFVFPPQILDMLVQGLMSGGSGLDWHVIHPYGSDEAQDVWMMTDAGPITILRGPDMERA